MPMVNYCRKCKREVPTGELCACCGTKLSKTGERLSFGIMRKPVRDWFAWNSLLRVFLPVMVLVTFLVILIEGAAAGASGLLLLLTDGFLGMLAAVLCGVLLLIGLALCAQGEECVHFVLDKNGAHAYLYLEKPTTLKLWSRLLTWQAVEPLQKTDEALDGMLLIQRREIGWQQARRLQCWPETGTLLFYRPSWWQALAVRCPASEFEEAQAYALKKMARVKGASVKTKA